MNYWIGRVPTMIDTSKTHNKKKNIKNKKFNIFLLENWKWMKIITDNIRNSEKRVDVYEQIFLSIASDLPTDFDKNLLSSMLSELDPKWLSYQLIILMKYGIQKKKKNSFFFQPMEKLSIKVGHFSTFFTEQKLRDWPLIRL